MAEPTPKQKYEFINDHLMLLKVGQQHTVVMEGRVYDIKYRGEESNVFRVIGKEAASNGTSQTP
jgi:hypothetical protein